MVCAGQSVFGMCGRRWRQIPGWNEFVRKAHSEAREALLADDGPCWGPPAERMRSTRTRFKFCLRWCKSHVIVIQAA